jgi:hypothetical protein
MTMSPDEILAFKVGGATLGENLRRAIESGAVTEREDGTLELPKPPANDLWLISGKMPGCGFLNGLMFRHAYGQAAVPKGCEGCYKVKVLPRTLRELVALFEIAQTLECTSKCGIDFYNRHSPNVYAGYFYLDGLEQARSMSRTLRDLVDQNPKLGLDVPVVIKRGCSNYEAACGPSDRYAFAPELAEIEAYLKTRFQPLKVARSQVAAAIYGTWVPFAYQFGDQTYLDFTNGKPLYPKSTTYDPNGS